jgi:hypothetical protein
MHLWSVMVTCRLHVCEHGKHFFQWHKVGEFPN